MACNTCIQNNDCGCNTPCPPEICACPILIKSDCVDNVTEDLVCSGILAGQTLTEVLVQLDAFICEKFDQTTAYFTLLNVGTGAEVYKGVNGVGNKLIRKINKVGNLITVTQNTDDISISIDETALDTFIEANQKTYSVANLGIGASVYKDSTVVGNNTQFNLKKIKSSTLSITATNDEIDIDLSNSVQIPALYVNDLYEPTYEDWVNAGGDLIVSPTFLYRGEGTLSKPFTNSRNYTSSVVFTDIPNSAIQNALDGHPTLSYVGAGTRLSPSRGGEKIIVQDNNTQYTFSGDFGYSQLDIVLEGNVYSTTTGYLIDMDNASHFDADYSSFTIEIKEGGVLEIQGEGFRNSGNTSSTPPSYTNGRIGIFKGDGLIYTAYNGVNVLTRYIFNGDGNNNDDGLHFQVACKVKASYQGIYFTKNKMKIDFYNQLISGEFQGSVNLTLKAFHMEGGQIRFYEKGSISISGESSGRNYGFTFEPIGTGVGNTNFQLNSAKVAGNCNYCFAKLNNESVLFLAFNSPSGDGFSTTLPGSPTPVAGLFENLGVTPWAVSFKNNIFSFTGIDQTKVDLTQGNNISTTNFIGNNVIENLVVYNSKSSAIGAGISPNSAILKRVTVTAGSCVVGQEYKIASLGTTDFTLIGASSNTLGLWFTANGVGTGTGTMYLETREVI